MNFNRSVILLLAFIGEASTYLLAPVLPIIAHTFAVSSAMSQLTVTFNLIGMTIATTVYGPLSDLWGRKKIMLIGLTIFVTSSVLCFFAQDLKLLIFSRFLQGLGEGAVVVVSYATIADIYDEIQEAQLISQRNLIVNCSAAVAPIIGGAIATYFAWQGIFSLLAVLGIMILVWVNFYFIETLNSHKNNKSIRTNNNNQSILAGYCLVLKRPNFLIYGLIESIPFIGIWGTVTSLPFIFAKLGVKTNHYGFYVLIYTTFYLVGIILNQFLLKHIKIDNLIMIGALIGMFDIVPLAWGYITPLSPLLIAWLWGPSCFGLAFIIGNAATKALEVAEDHSGVGSAVIVVLYTFMGVLGIYFIGKFCHGEITLLFWTTTLSSVATIILLLIAQKKKIPELMN